MLVIVNYLRENSTSGGWAVPSSEQTHYVWFVARYINYQPIETKNLFYMNKILSEIWLLLTWLLWTWLLWIYQLW